MTMPQHDPNLLAYLQGWRQYLEQVASSAVAPGLLFAAMPQLPFAPMPLAPPPFPPMPPIFGMPTPPAVGALTNHPAGAPADHTQQLLTALQVWRQFLEQSLDATMGGATDTPGKVSSRAETGSRPTPIDNGPKAAAAADHGTNKAGATADHGTNKAGAAADHAGADVSAASLAAEEPPVARAGSAYAAEAQAGSYVDNGYATPRSLYSNATAAGNGDTATTTEWWQVGQAVESTSESTGSESPPARLQGPSLNRRSL